MSKYLLGAAAAAFLMVGVSGGAMADPAACTAQFGALPNAKWQWQVTDGTPSYSFDNERGAGESSNVFADVYRTTTLMCNAVNPAGNIAADKGGEIGGTPELLAENVKVCDKNGQTTAGGTYGFEGC